MQLTQEYFNHRTKDSFSPSEQRVLWSWFNENLAENSPWEDWLVDLLNGKPVQYIFGYAFFHKYKYSVNSSVLIPRPETEELCELILKYNSSISELNCMEIGIGSGCISNTLALESKNWTFEGIDISAGAVKTAQLNAKTYKIDNRVNYRIEDFFSIYNRENSFDIIVSNPPYIHSSEKQNLSTSVTNFEPHEALFVKTDVLEYYTGLFEYFKNNNNPNSQCWLECHQDYCQDVLGLFSRQFRAKKIEDLSGNPRFVFVEK